MTAEAVLQVLELLERSHVRVSVDGGWGVDALLGHQTRTHADLDLVLAAGDVDEARACLSTAGFLVLHDLLPTAIAYSHPDGRGVDLHPVTPTPDGGGDQDPAHAGLGEDAEPFHYGPPVRGSIAGTQVWCVDGATQLRAHSGYALTEKDRADVAAVRRLMGAGGCVPQGDK
jgi:lincosamide nucleotidyltransferase A/C/D/E